MEKESSTTTKKGAVTPINPTPFLKSLLGKDIVVRLKWGMEYKGTLACADAYMNLQLSNAEEYIEGESQGVMDMLLIRCNNILYIREKDPSNRKNSSEEVVEAD